jgi:hypothetical protein
MIPDGTEILTVQIMFEISSGTCNGLRFLDRNRTPMLACGGMVEDPNCLADPEFLI